MFNFTTRILPVFIYTVFILSGCGASAEEDTVKNQAPDVILKSNSAQVNLSDSITLSWSSNNAENCIASGDWSGSRSSSGSQIIGSLQSDSIFYLKCSGSGGEASDSVSVTIAAPENITISLNASSSNVLPNGSTTLNWSSNNANKCVASGNWSGNKATTGSETINGLTANSSFVLNCTGAGGTASDSVNVTVSSSSATVPAVTLSASQLNLLQNEPTTLTWSSSNATSCTASGDWSGNKATTGSETINGLTANSSFVLNCTGAGGTVSDSVNVTVVLSFPGNALLSWTPPTQNTDGSALTDLAGHKIHYGTTPGNYSKSITVSGAGISSFQVDNLPPATWYFAMTSFNSTGLESAYSSEVSKAIN